MDVLIVGATGVLRPAVHTLTARGHTVHALARHASNPSDARPPGLVRALLVDHGDVDALREVLAGRPRFDAAVVYAPTAPAVARQALADRVDGVLVELITTAWADPRHNPRADIGTVDSVGTPLLLGWIGTRWHTPQEMSAAAVAVLDRPVPTLLGTVRPWSGRPR